jgi:nucleotide-binding universal stress UspA family protein
VSDSPCLLCFDGTEPAAAAVRAAGRLLTARHAVVATVWRANGGSPSEHEAGRLAGEGCELALEADVSAEPRPVPGDHVAAAVVALAREVEAGTIVVGARPAAARHPRLLGSVSRAVAHGADRPVLVAHESEDAGPAIIAYDGSDAAREAIAAAGELLGGGAALVVHVWLPPSHVLLWNPLVKGPGPLAEPAEMLDDTAADGARRLAAEGAAYALDSGFSAKPLTVPVEHGTWRTLLRVAREQRSRVIVVGSHGTSPLDIALGTVADRVTTNADRPVLMVPGRARAAAYQPR